MFNEKHSKVDTSTALKYDTSLEKLPWDLLPVEAVEGMLRVLAYGARKYSICGDCGAKIYPNPRLDEDTTRDDCPSCKSKNIATGKHNWRKGFKYTRLIAAAFRHLKAILQGEDIDDGPLGSGLPHVDHLLCMVAFLSGHMKCGYGTDDRFKHSKPKKIDTPKLSEHTKKEIKAADEARNIAREKAQSVLFRGENNVG